jgi:hypothetical protein
MTGIKYLMLTIGTLFLSLVLMGSEVKAGEAKDDRIKLSAPRYEGKTSKNRESGTSSHFLLREEAK